MPIALTLLFLSGVLVLASAIFFASALRARRQEQGADMDTITYPRFRPNVCFCLNSLSRKHGIQGQLERGEPYRTMAEDGAPLLFNSSGERDAKLSDIRSRLANGTLDYRTNPIDSKGEK